MGVDPKAGLIEADSLWPRFKFPQVNDRSMFVMIRFENQRHIHGG